MTKRSYSMQDDGKHIVNVEALLASSKVQRDLQTIREKISETETRHGFPKGLRKQSALRRRRMPA